MRWILKVMLLFVMLAVLPACGDDTPEGLEKDNVPADVDQANFAKVKVDMSKQEVEKLIGKPYEYFPQDFGEVGKWTKKDLTKFTVVFDQEGTVVSINKPPPDLEYKP